MASSNPLRDNVHIQDQIIQVPALNPQAQVVGSPYQAPTRANVAEVPATNRLEKLSAALSSLTPAMNQGIGMMRKNMDEKDVERANAQWAASKQTLGDATRTGQIPPGESTLFNDTWRSLDAQDIARQYTPALWQEWSQHPDAMNPDKPKAFEQFRQQFRADWDKKNLIDPDTQHAKFTPHQLLTARYNDTLDAADQHLTSHNTGTMINELTEKGKDTLNKNIQTSISQAMKNLDGSPKSPELIDWTAAAKSAKDAAYGQTTGLVTTGGLPPHLATEVTAQAVAQQIMDSKDISIGPKMGAELDKLDPSHPISGTQKWKSMIQTATEHAVSQQTQTLQNQVWNDERDAQGGSDMIKERIKDVTATADNERQIAKWTKADANIVLSSKNLENPTPDESKASGEAMARLFKYNPEKAQFLTKEIRGLEEHLTDRIEKDRYSENEVDIYQAIEKNPGAASTADLIDQARKGKYIDGPTWQRLRQENKEMGMAAQQFKGILDSPVYTNLEQGVKNSLIDPTKPFGEKSIAAAQAAHEFRQEAISTLQHNPGMDVSQLSKVMEPRMKAMHLKCNETAQQYNAQREEDQAINDKIVQGALTRDQANAIQKNDGRTFKNKNGETVTQTHEQTQQILRATEEQNAIDKADKQSLQLPKEVKGYLSGPAPEKLGEYMTKADKLSILESVRRTYEPGISERPISQTDLRDQVRDVLSKHYSNPHELNDAVSGLVDRLSAKYRKKSQQAKK